MPSLELTYTLEGDRYNAEMSPVFLSETRVLTARENGMITAWDLKKNGQKLYSFKAHRKHRGGGAVGEIALNPTRRRLATGGHGGVKIWNVSKAEVIHTLPTSLDAVLAVAWSVDGRLIASGDPTSMRLWDARRAKQIDCADVQHLVTEVAFSPNNDLVAFAGSHSTIYIWSLESRGLLCELKGHRAPIISLSVSRDGKTLASCSEDGDIKIWNLMKYNVIKTLRARHSYGSVEFSPTGHFLASVDLFDGHIRFWDLNSFRQTKVGSHSGNWGGLRFSPSGMFLATHSNELPGRIRVWSVGETT